MKTLGTGDALILCTTLIALGSLAFVSFVTLQLMIQPGIRQHSACMQLFPNGR